MKRLILVLALTAMMLVGSALPLLAQDMEDSQEPRDPQCGWYSNWDEEEEWWEYWCYYPRWGWEYVFWSY